MGSRDYFRAKGRLLMAWLRHTGIAWLALLAGFAPAQAATFGAGIENSRWFTSESIFDCTISHEIPGYGRAMFQHRAGENLRFVLEAPLTMMQTGTGALVIEAPAWRPGADVRPLGGVEIRSGTRPVEIGGNQAMAIVSGLLEGMAPTITRQSSYNPGVVRVRLSNINFHQAFQSYQRCVTNLLPVNFDQVQRSRILFAVNSNNLSDRDRAQLDNIVTYILADNTVTRVFIDGHTDRSGSRITNRVISEERATAVANYLLNRGLPEDLLIVRAHGDQFPVSNRPAENRRVTIRLEREGDNPPLRQAAQGGTSFNGS